MVIANDQVLFLEGIRALRGVHRCSPRVHRIHQGGRLYLDELSSLPLETQAKLLRVLESREVYRLGETNARPVDFRLLASSQQDLLDRVRDGTFRLDLFQRAAGIRIDLVPLRKRIDDIPAACPTLRRAAHEEAYPGGLRRAARLQVAWERA